MKKRILSLIVTVLMVVSLFSAFSINVNAANISFQYKPTVYIGGGGYYNIVWKNNVKSLGYVTYRFDGKNYTVYDEEDGVVRSDDYIHTVRVPVDHLDAAGEYTVTAKEVINRTGYNITTGSDVTFTSSFTGYHGQSTIKWAFISDTHLWKGKMGCRDSAVKAVNDYMGGVDMVVLNGDIANNMPTEDDFDCVLDIANSTTEGAIPVLYVKGNHECRGYYGQKLYKYLVYDTDEFYSNFDYGPISSIIFDIGEDKEDGHLEYGGLNDMEHYKAEQVLWIQNHPGYTEGSTYHLALSHAPNLVDYYYTDEFATVAQSLGTDVLIAGHSHQQKYVSAADSKIGIPVVHDGGHNDNTTMRTTLVTFSNDTIKCEFLTDGGAVSGDCTIKATHKGYTPKKTETVSKAPVADKAEDVAVVEKTDSADEVVVPTAAGVSTNNLKGAVEKTAMASAPVVFDSGAYYHVVWQTTPGIEAAGYVDISSSAGSVSYMDSFSGKCRVNSTHSVKIPKAVLQGTTYTVSSKVVTNYNMYGYARPNDMTSYGPTVSGNAVKFDGAPADNQKKYTILALANLRGKSEKAEEIRKSFKNLPDFVVTLGDMVENLDKEENFKAYLDTLGVITDGGKVPVMMLRGDAESTGEFAANLGYYVRSATEQAVIGKFYTNYAFGKVSVVGLDTAAAKADGNNDYYGLASFQNIREEQVDWLIDTVPNIQKGDFNLVFANAPDLTNVHGVNYTDGLIDMDTNLVVTAGSGSASYDDNKSYGLVKVGDSNGVMLTCIGDEITIEALLGKGTTEELAVLNTTEKVASKDEGGSTSEPTDKPEDKPDVDPDDDNKDDDISSDDDNTGNNTNTGSQGTGDSGDYKETTTTTTTTQKEYVEGTFDGLDTNYYVRTVPEGWYKDYIGISTFADVSKVASNGAMTESVFVHVIARLVAVNYDNYSSYSTDADKASAWIESCGIYSGNLASETVVTDAVIDSVIKGIFAA